VGACALTVQGDKALIESRTRSVRSENSTQPVESQSTESSSKTRSPWDCTRYQHQPTIKSVRGGLSLSFAYVSWSEPDKRQHNPDQSNSRLPIRLASPMIFYQEWIRQQGKVPPDQTPFVPMNAQSNCPVKVELDDGDVRDQFPASAVGLQAERTPIDSTVSNQEDREECPSVSPIEPVSEPTVSVVRDDTVMSESNRDGRPDKDNVARYMRDEAIYDNVQVLWTPRDLQVSHNGVPVTSKGYNDIRTSNTEV